MKEKKFIFTRADGTEEVFMGRIVKWLERFSNGNGFAVVAFGSKHQTLALTRAEQGSPR